MQLSSQGVVGISCRGITFFAVHMGNRHTKLPKRWNRISYKFTSRFLFHAKVSDRTFLFLFKSCQLVSCTEPISILILIAIFSMLPIKMNSEKSYNSHQLSGIKHLCMCWLLRRQAHNVWAKPFNNIFKAGSLANMSPLWHFE